ncbi:putative membrane protein YngA [Cohnella xylanilytica]|uniref:GtrA family protein n=1 Tax=Cohnella xylanilytica TaxID=557555 RepID=A0A841U1I8_9BACL|nr:GtrA family protein [Cohnella xylanilytica]MBB6691981.1 GtrA family protein [Cohnella xylanilytica]GIO11124.1 putative membrane protein YngA [Cohnella xylanilytica]
MNDREWRKMAKFALVGAMNTGVDFAVFAALVYGLEAKAIAAQPVSYLCGFLNSYLWNRSWTFKSGKRASASELIRFGAVNLLSFALATAVLLGLEQGLGWNALAGKAASILASLAANYAGSRLWVFREAGERGERSPDSEAV